MDRGVRPEPSGGPPPAISNSYERLAARGAAQHDEQDDEEEVLEQDREGRFSRYGHVVGSGRFKTVFKAFDERRGVDVAWSKIMAADNQLSREQVARVVDEMSTGLALDHPNVIRSYQCWEDHAAGCINLITEYFTSGNLHDYRHRHKALDLKALKKWARQILQGLAYLHGREPPVVHGDLRADKIYINGHSGEIKIGDLGLSVLVPKRFAPGVMPEGEPSNQYTCAVDVFAFGLVMLELVTLKRTHKTTNTQWVELLEAVDNAGVRAFLAQCLAPVEERPSAADLLKDPFLQPPPKQQGSGPGGGGAAAAAAAAAAALAAEGGDLRRGDGGGAAAVAHGHGDADADAATGVGVRRRSSDDGRAEPGSVRGEDYLFQFSGKIRGGKLHFRLHMDYEGESDDGGMGAQPGGGSGLSSKTIDFVYDPEVDTPDEIAAEISSEFNLSPTDRDICAAALKEWLADQGPDPR